MNTAQCPRCGRSVSSDQGRWAAHAITHNGSNYCSMSKQRVAIQGCTPADYSMRATLVCDLAAQLRDVDPVVVWDYLTGLPADELQRMTMVALAGIDVDSPISEVFGWVQQLPAARSA